MFAGTQRFCQMPFKAVKKEHSIQPNTVNEHSSPPSSPTDTHIYPLKHTPPSGRRWGLTNRPFISCQSGFIGFKWSLITTVLQSLITVFFFPIWGRVGRRVGWGGVSVSRILSLPQCTSLHFATFATFHFNEDSFPSLILRFPADSTCLNIRVCL